METVGLILIIAGVVVTLVGLFILLKAKAPEAPAPPSGAQEGVVGDIGELFGKIKEFLEVFDKYLRAGVFVVTVGVAMIAIGASLVALDAKSAADDAEDAAGTTAALPDAPDVQGQRELPAVGS